MWTTRRRCVNLAESVNRRERYQRVLRTIDYQTGYPDSHQRAGVTRPTLTAILVNHTGIPLDRAKATIQAAIQNDDVFQYRDRDGRPRLALATPEGLRAVIAEENHREHPDLELIEACASQLNNDR